MKRQLIKHLAMFWVGCAIMALSYAIVHISKTIIKVNENIPEIIDQVASINQQIDTITQSSIPTILDALPPITQQVDQLQKQIPIALQEVNTIQTKTIPSVLEQTNSISTQIPAILQRIDSLDKRIPASLDLMQQAMFRVDTLQQQIPLILATVKETNDSISSYMIVAEEMMMHADEIADEIGRNVSRGVLGGIVSSPLHAAKGIGNFVLGVNSKLTKEDAIIIEQLVVDFLNKNNDEIEQKWESPKIGKSGTFKVIKTHQKRGQIIKRVQILFNEIDEKLTVQYIQKADKHWYFKK